MRGPAVAWHGWSLERFGYGLRANALRPASSEPRVRSPSVALMYHGVLDRPRRTYDVSLAAFDRQLLAMSTRRVVSLSRLSAGESGIALTFDDGDASCVRNVAPRLRDRGWPATAFITTSFLGRPGFVARSDLNELRQAGITIGAHGHTHRSLNQLSDAAVREELRRCKAILEDIMGSQVVEFALPGGAGGSRERALACEAGFELIATSWPACERRGRRRSHVPRVPLTRETSDGEFYRVLSGSPTFYWRRQLRVASVAVASWLLGAGRYKRYRAAILGAYPLSRSRGKGLLRRRDSALVEHHPRHGARCWFMIPRLGAAPCVAHRRE